MYKISQDLGLSTDLDQQPQSRVTQDQIYVIHIVSPLDDDCNSVSLAGSVSRRGWTSSGLG
jgi:hypothetical protein